MTDEEFWDSFPDTFRWPEEHPLDRFYSRIKITQEGCWEWIGTHTVQGYGVFTIGHYTQRTYLLAHRFMLTIVNGKVHNTDVHHKCRNTSCVNPEHLEDISRQDHMEAHPMIFATDPPSDCCASNPYIRGLCKRHYSRISHKVRTGRASWFESSAQQECAA